MTPAEEYFAIENARLQRELKAQKDANHKLYARLVMINGLVSLMKKPKNLTGNAICDALDKICETIGEKNA